MALRIIGAHPLAKDANGRLISRIGTLFPFANTLVTLPGMHATQRIAFVDTLEQERQQQGLGPLKQEDRSAVWQNAVDLIMEDDAILIRPDPHNMGLAFLADEILTDFCSTRQVRFLYVENEKVREAITRRGDAWRITPLPKSPSEMRQRIRSSRIGINCREIYYYNNATGSRFLTCQEFAKLGELEDGELRRHLHELQQHSAATNRLGNPEISFFLADKAVFSKLDFAPYDFLSMDVAELRETYEWLRERFYSAVPIGLRQDDLDNLEWRNRMFATLIGQRDEAVPEETLLGLSSEFYMQIEWLPGGSFEEGEFIVDPIFERPQPGQDRDPLCDQKVLGFIFNFIREYGDLEHANVGRVVESLSRGRTLRGRREVFIAEILPRGSHQEIVKIIRMQKWGVIERLKEGKSLELAMTESEEYTDYVLDRRLGCRQLGMNILPRFVSGKITETYQGTRPDCRGRTIWSPYFERDYVRGIASDKIPIHRFKNDVLALRFAHLMGEAAAPNIIVGRCDLDGPVVFDDGDEVIIEDDRGLPEKIVVVDQMGTFNDYCSELAIFASDYADPIVSRLSLVNAPEVFAETYLEAFLERFLWIQAEYRRRKRAFDNLFAHRHWDERGSYAYRWYRTLQRLNSTDPRELTGLIRQHIVNR